MIDDAVSAVLALRATLLDGDVTEDNYLDIALKIMSNDKVSALLMAVSESKAFSSSFQSAFREDIERLRALKKLKFWYNSSGPEVMVSLGALLDSSSSNGLRSALRAVSDAMRSGVSGQGVVAVTGKGVDGDGDRRTSKLAVLLQSAG